MSEAPARGKFVVPLFPLPSIVLFPRAVLPLHVFEERYKAMTRDALAGKKRIAMAMLKTGWEKSYYGKPALAPVVCVGQILSQEKLPDGKYNFLLQGMMRATIIREVGDDLYRQAEVVPMVETHSMEIDLANERQKLASLFGDCPFAEVQLVKQFRQLLASPMSTSEVADLIAFNFFEDVAFKQSLLADADVQHRVQRVIRAVETVRPGLEARAKRMTNRPMEN